MCIFMVMLPDDEYFRMMTNLENDLPDWSLEVKTDIESEIQARGFEIIKLDMHAKTDMQTGYGHATQLTEHISEHKLTLQWVLNGVVEFIIYIDDFLITSCIESSDVYRQINWNIIMKVEGKITGVFIGILEDVIEWIIRNKKCQTKK